MIDDDWPDPNGGGPRGAGLALLCPPPRGGEPVAGVALFAGISATALARLNSWTVDACRIAKERGVQIVQIKLIFLGGSRYYFPSILENLRQFVDAADRNRNTDVYRVQTAAAQLTSTFRGIFAVKRNLRSLN